MSEPEISLQRRKAIESVVRMKESSPLLLISNDDGIEAAGILSLVAVMDSLADVVVVAPIQEMSAIGHAITMREPVRARSWPFRGPSGPILAYADIRGCMITRQARSMWEESFAERLDPFNKTY